MVLCLCACIVAHEEPVVHVRESHGAVGIASERAVDAIVTVTNWVSEPRLTASPRVLWPSHMDEAGVCWERWQMPVETVTVTVGDLLLSFLGIFIDES